MNLWRKFHPNRTIGNYSKIDGKVWEGGTLKKIQMSQMPSQNESIKEVLSKSDNGKVFKIRGKISNTY